MNKLSHYSSRAADWRKQLRINDRRTRFVIISFLFIYTVVGLLIDLFLLHPRPVNVTLLEDLLNLITLRTIPIFTIITFLAALISIFIAYALYDRIVMLGTEHKEINLETASSLEEQKLYNVVDELRVAAGLDFMPKVFIIEAPYMNAFASGYSEKSALVAITRGLMQKLNRSELQAVMAHELNHIRHHDIKLTLAASIMCNILLIAIDIVFRGALYGGIGGGNRRRSDRGGSNLILIIILLRLILPILTMILMLFLSRSREYMADAGAVELMRDNAPLANALLKIQNDHQENAEKYAEVYQKTAHEDVRRSAYIFEPVSAGIHGRQSLATLFSTHPSIEDRLRALGFQHSGNKG